MPTEKQPESRSKREKIVHKISDDEMQADFPRLRAVSRLEFYSAAFQFEDETKKWEVVKTVMNYLHYNQSPPDDAPEHVKLTYNLTRTETDRDHRSYLRTCKRNAWKKFLWDNPDANYERWEQEVYLPEFFAQRGKRYSGAAAALTSSDLQTVYLTESEPSEHLTDDVPPGHHERLTIPLKIAERPDGHTLHLLQEVSKGRNTYTVCTNYGKNDNYKQGVFSDKTEAMRRFSKLQAEHGFGESREVEP